jgi:hypothetical protein
MNTNDNNKNKEIAEQLLNELVPETLIVPADVMGKSRESDEHHDHDEINSKKEIKAMDEQIVSQPQQDDQQKEEQVERSSSTFSPPSVFGANPPDILRKAAAGMTVAATTTQHTSEEDTKQQTCIERAHHFEPHTYKSPTCCYVCGRKDCNVPIVE